MSLCTGTLRIMTELINSAPAAAAPVYDPDSTGWIRPEMPEVPPARPAAARVRCGSYLHPETRDRLWGDHRVSFPGSTCRDVSCYTSHYVYAAPGWPEPTDPAADGYDLYSRPGVSPIASALWGWNNAGHLPERLDEQAASNAANVALDALRDAGYAIIAPPVADIEDGPTRPAAARGA
jgi:hypothetical protein